MLVEGQPGKRTLIIDRLSGILRLGRWTLFRQGPAARLWPKRPPSKKPGG